MDTKKRAETVRLATVEVVRKQATIGLDIISDGEFGKSSWSNYILSRVTGFEVRPDQLRPVEWLGRDLQRFGDVIGREMPSVLTGRRRKRALVRSSTGLCSHWSGDR
jgi:5-methyltetrahydropteroyltriglutamate--homocysteine methyltransferase